jgi:Ca2+-binding RTX toxin-like protein
LRRGEKFSWSAIDKRAHGGFVSTPISNSVVATQLLVSGLGNISGILDGYRWGAVNQNPTYLTYSFPGATGGSGYFDPNYGSDSDQSEWYAGWTHLTSAQRSAVATALTQFTKTAALSFSPVSDNNVVVGDLRFAISEEPPYAFAYTPFNTPAAGDIWFSYDEWNQDYYSSVPKGSYGYVTILHEIGHALGLKHPFEWSLTNFENLAVKYDSLMFTVMSYQAYAGLAYTDSEADRYPTTPMYLDVAALEYLYGRSTANSGATSWTYSTGGSYWETIVDGGGVDTLTYNSAFGEYTRMSLLTGDYCGFGQLIAYSGAGATHDNRTVWIGPSTMIENAVGGVGREDMFGNGIANHMRGLGGDDTIRGGGGADKLDGGADTDKLIGGKGADILIGGAGFDTFVFDNLSGGADKVNSFSHGDDSIFLDDKVFTKLPDGVLASSHYREAANVDAVGATKTGQWILYDTDSGKLWYDPDATGPASKILIATFVGSPDSVAPNDFTVI